MYLINLNDVMGLINICSKLIEILISSFCLWLKNNTVNLRTKYSFSKELNLGFRKAIFKLLATLPFSCSKKSRTQKYHRWQIINYTWLHIIALTLFSYLMTLNLYHKTVGELFEHNDSIIKSFLIVVFRYNCIWTFS